MPTDKALKLAEDFLRQRLLVRDHVADLKASPHWQRLPERPVQTIGGDLAISVDIDSIGDGWVRLPDRDCKVSYRAGMAYTEDALPAPISRALELIDVMISTNPESHGDLDEQIKALLRPYRRLDPADAQLSAIG